MKALKDMVIPLIITIGAILTSVVAWIQWRSENDSKILNDKLNTENKQLLNRIADLSESTVNNITGGDSRPVLYIEAEKVLIPSNPLKECFIVKFDIKNHGEKYPLRKVVCEITDAAGFAMLKFLKVERSGLEYKYDLDSHVNEMSKFELVHKYNLGTINTKASKPLYATSYQNIEGIKDVDKNSPPGYYQVIVNAENVSLDYAIYMSASKDEFFIDKVILKENGIEIDPGSYFQFHFSQKVITL